MGIKRRHNAFAKKKRNNKPKKTKPLPIGQFTVTIDELLSDGRGLATVDNRRIMIDGALPDETVLFEYQNEKQQFFEGKTIEVIKPSPFRVAPKCEFFAECGGCSLQHLQADEQIAYKQKQLLSNLQKQAKTQPKILAGPLISNHWGYRHRARVGLKWIKEGNIGTVHIGFRGKNSGKIVPITHCEVLVPELSVLLTPIADMVAELSNPDSITHVEMTAGDNALSLTFRHVLPLSSDDENKLSVFADRHNVVIYLQGNDDKDVRGLNNHQQQNEYIINIISEKDKENTTTHKPLSMAFMPYHFTQVNFSMNQKMLKQAIDWLDLCDTDEVLDLFCGLGNFTLPIAQRVKSVVGVEGLLSLVNWAKQNAEKNAIGNADFYQADLTQDTRMMMWRVKRSYNKVLIDPPRSGALEIMPLIAEIAPEKICYVSCHSATLARDINILVNEYGYRLAKSGVMDMFPHTAHVECMALLEKRGV